jgi:hypothetical protein
MEKQPFFFGQRDTGCDGIVDGAEHKRLIVR